MEAYNYWNSDDGFRAIQNPAQHGEGVDMVEYYKALVDELLPGASVFDFGCGKGRLSKAFDKSGYLGYDICAKALETAHKTNKGYNYITDLPLRIDRDIFFAATAFLHMKEEEIREVLCRVESKYIIISEVMGYDWRRDGMPPAYNRPPMAYDNLLYDYGYRPLDADQIPYEHYASWNRDNTNLVTLVYVRGWETC
jgi:SAM-dependent methyltransferase